MSRPSTVFQCGCEACVVANTPAVRFPAWRGKVPVMLHGRAAARYIDAQRRGSERISELAERLRQEFGISDKAGA